MGWEFVQCLLSVSVLDCNPLVSLLVPTDYASLPAYPYLIIDRAKVRHVDPGPGVDPEVLMDS